VAIVAASLRYVGGQSVQADLLMRAWQKDPNVEARLLPIDPVFPSVLKWAERVPLLRTLIRQPIYMLKLWRELKHVDIAHIFSASYWSFMVAPAPALLIARLRGKKVLLHYHSGEARDHLRRFRSARPILKRADRLVVPSGYLVEVFCEFGLDAQAIPNIVDLSQFSYRSRKPLRPHLVCTRGFHPYYCVDVVVRAFVEVQKAYPDAQLDLVGGGPLESEIRNLVRELNLTGVNFAGIAPHSEIGRFYDQADIFINASRLDNMPVSVLEAFASGTVVVTTEPEGMRYIVEHGRTGLLSPTGDARALAQNVIRVLNDAELAERLALNARREMERYCWPVVREQWLETYRTLVSRNPPAVEELTPAGVDESHR
jgi:glycosyltransferase involved in cell wall biosynthesis